MAPASFGVTSPIHAAIDLDAFYPAPWPLWLPQPQPERPPRGAPAPIGPLRSPLLEPESTILPLVGFTRPSVHSAHTSVRMAGLRFA
ncbi:hypothetical protein V6N13_007803 [Hibiscus sabdariffa]